MEFCNFCFSGWCFIFIFRSFWVECLIFFVSTILNLLEIDGERLWASTSSSWRDQKNCFCELHGSVQNVLSYTLFYLNIIFFPFLLTSCIVPSMLVHFYMLYSAPNKKWVCICWFLSALYFLAISCFFMFSVHAPPAQKSVFLHCICSVIHLVQHLYFFFAGTGF